MRLLAASKWRPQAGVALARRQRVAFHSKRRRSAWRACSGCPSLEVVLHWVGGDLRMHLQVVLVLVSPAALAVAVRLMRMQQRLPWLPERKLVILQLSEHRPLQRCGG